MNQLTDSQILSIEASLKLIMERSDFFRREEGLVGYSWACMDLWAPYEILDLVQLFLCQTRAIIDEAETCYIAGGNK